MTFKVVTKRYNGTVTVYPIVYLYQECHNRQHVIYRFFPEKVTSNKCVTALEADQIADTARSTGTLLSINASNVYRKPYVSELLYMIFFNGSMLYFRAFQLKSFAGRTPVSRVVRRAAWSKNMGVLQIF